jgi:hypothetical protein
LIGQKAFAVVISAGAHCKQQQVSLGQRIIWVHF